MSYRWFTAEQVASWPPEHKQCRGCHEVLPLSSFTKQRGCLMGHATSCRDCRKPKSRQNHQAYVARGVAFNLWSRAKRRAAAKGVPFSITIKDVAMPDVCPVFGRTFIVNDPDWAPSLDRVIPERGYVPGNVRVISIRANMIKNNASVAEVQAVLRYMMSESS